MQIPTILIGLGGTGSQIVDKVYGWLPESQRELVAIHAFDTDVNDIEKLEHLGKDSITQTSTNYTVGQYLSIATPNVKEWFPYEITELHRKTLTDGAGQIRAVSRLAYRAAMEKGALSSLDDSLSKIQRLKEDGRITNIRIAIVCTLAGGTGAGIFLQTAMYLRQTIKEKFSKENVIIRGIFILPDTLVLNRTLAESEFDNVRSNAYACIKELNAIFRVTCAKAENVQIEMEFRPKQNENELQKGLTLGTQNLPYDYCVLYDYQNEDGNNIGSYENYKNMVARTSFFELFTPLSTRLFSKLDNQIRELLANNSLSRFCSAGLASIIYPYNDIVNYHALKWVFEFLSAQWLTIDEKVRQEYKDYENDLAKGINREAFNYGSRFTKNIEELCDDNSFFKRVIREVNSLDKDNNPIKFKSTSFIEEIDKEIDGLFSNDKKLMEAKKDCEINENELKDKDTVRREVTRVEENLRQYKDEINRFIKDNRRIIVEKATIAESDKIIQLAATGDFSSYTCQHRGNLNYWMLNESEPVNPISARFILYQLINELDNQIKVLNSDTERLRKLISDYETKAYDLTETDEIAETAEDRLRIAMKQSLWGKMFSTNDFKLFIEDYTEKSNGQLSRLNEFRKKILQLEVYRILNDYLNGLSRDFENYFSILHSIKLNLQKELNKNLLLHDESADPTIIYTHASKNDKEMQWENIKLNYVNNGIPTEISKQIYMSLFSKLCQRTRMLYTSELENSTVEHNFRESVLKWCRNQIAGDERLNISCIEAIRKEAENKGTPEKDVNSFIQDKIRSLNVLSKAFIMRPISLRLAELSTWGMHPLSKNALTPARYNDIFQAEDVVIEESLSKYEIVKEKMLYGLKAEDLVKFLEPAGVYYISYKKIIDAMRRNSNIVTPHLDKRWHLPAYLPSLTQQGIMVETEKTNRAFILGLSMGYLNLLDNNGRLNWYYKGDASGMQIINISADQACGRHAYQLHQALMYNPAIVDKILDTFGRDRERDIERYSDYKEHTFYKKSISINLISQETNILQLVLAYPEGMRADSELVKKSLTLLETAIKEIKAYIVNAIGVHRHGDINKEYNEYLNLLKTNSEHYTKADSSSVIFNQWKEVIEKQD